MRQRLLLGVVLLLGCVVVTLRIEVGHIRRPAADHPPGVAQNTAALSQPAPARPHPALALLPGPAVPAAVGSTGTDASSSLGPSSSPPPPPSSPPSPPQSPPGCRPGDTGCAIKLLREQLSFTGVGDGGCTSTDRDCIQEYSRWLAGVRPSATPSGIHLSLGRVQGRGDQRDHPLAVSWSTGQTAARDCSQLRLFSPAASHASGTVLSSGAWAEHTVELAGLERGKAYGYRVGCDAHGWSNIRRLRLPAEDAGQAFSFLATADSGSTYAARRVFRSMALRANASSAPVGFALHGGDVTYGADGVSSAKAAALAAAFYEAAEPLASMVPVANALGNHDLRVFGPGRGDGEGGTPYRLRPGQDDGELHYSFSYRSVRVVVLDAEGEYRRGSPQHEWLRQQMRSANTPAERRARPWLIVLMHRPIYSTAPWYENARERGTHGTAGDLTAELEELIAEAGADLVIAGHVHE